MDREKLERDIADVLNRHCAENASDTSDLILAAYLVCCLEAWNRTTQARDAWYGMNPEPGTEWAKDVPENPRLRDSL